MGSLHLLLRIPSGRIADHDGAPWLSGLRAIAQIHTGRFPDHAQPEPADLAGRRRAARSDRRAGASSTGWTCTSALCPCSRDAWPAWRCRHARWRWPRPSVTCRSFWARSRSAWQRTACRRRPCCCASPAARTAARARTWPRSAWSARPRDATTCTWAATPRASGSTCCTGRIWTRRRSSRCWTACSRSTPRERAASRSASAITCGAPSTCRCEPRHERADQEGRARRCRGAGRAQPRARTVERRKARGLVARTPARRSRADFELRRAGRRVPPPGDAPGAAPAR